MTIGLTGVQIDHICYQIGEWYLQWRDKIANFDDKTHNLGFAKEQLKEMICGNEYCDNSEKLKTEVEKLQEIIHFLENVSMILGITHGALSEILKSPDSELRDKLADLFQRLGKDIGKLYYEQPKR